MSTVAENNLADLARLVRYHILAGTTAAGSGHPTSSLSATDVMTALFFKYLKFDCDEPAHPNNDRVLFSKGHAAPLLYALYAAANRLTAQEILTLRQHDSPLEGHPTPHFKYAEVATGSLGQGLSAGVGMAINAKYLDKLPYTTFVLLGDGEMAEGSVWEAMMLAAHYKLSNLLAIVDVNRFGQSQETMFGHDAKAFEKRIAAFGWDVITIDGHSLPEIQKAFDGLLVTGDKPKAIVAKTFKGHGVDLIANKDGWHGKPLPQDKLADAMKALGPVDLNLRGTIKKPEDLKPQAAPGKKANLPVYKIGEAMATRRTYGATLAALVDEYPALVAIDGDTKNSTFAETLQKAHPDHFFEMFIAEQNMIGVGVGLAKRGKIVFASTFAAFLTRAFDQIRMAAVSQANLKCVGSHAGVAIGEDGPSQMGLEDLSMFRAIQGSTVLYPSDAPSTVALLQQMVLQKGIVYMRTNRPDTPVIYGASETFPIGGSKTVRSSTRDLVTVVAAGITLFEALKAHDALQKENIAVRIIDCYSVKPIDQATLQKAAGETRAIIVVEDHWYDGGLGDAVLNALAETTLVPVHKLAVTSMPRSGKPAELIDAAGISSKHIIKKIKSLL